MFETPNELKKNWLERLNLCVSKVGGLNWTKVSKKD